MIKNFKCKETIKIWGGIFSKKLPHDIQRTALDKLKILNNASDLHTLTVPPSNRLESLKGDRLGQWSIRINGQWRICFKWEENNALDVEIIDYH